MRSARWLFSLFVSFACFVGSTTHAADSVITRIGAEWRSAESFDRISEYFGGGENTRGRRVQRTQADTRAGFYFSVRLAQPAATTDAKFILAIITAEQPEPKTFSFSAASLNGETWFELGLTGADWPGGARSRPIAWRLALVSGDGHVLAEQKSFLWENPPK